MNCIYISETSIKHLYSLIIIFYLNITSLKKKLILIFERKKRKTSTFKTPQTDRKIQMKKTTNNNSTISEDNQPLLLNSENTQATNIKKHPYQKHQHESSLDSLILQPQRQSNIGGRYEQYSKDGIGGSEKRQLTVFTGTTKEENSKQENQLQNNPKLIEPHQKIDITILSPDPTTNKVAFTTRDTASGRMIICLLKPEEKIYDLKAKICQQEGFQINQLKITILKKEVADTCLLKDYVEDMQVHCFELNHTEPIISGSFTDARGSNLRLSSKPKKCVACSSKAADHCSTCGKPVCEVCGHWNTNVRSSFIINSVKYNKTGAYRDEEFMIGSTAEDLDVDEPSAVSLIPKKPPMSFFTQCPKCRTAMVERELGKSHGSLAAGYVNNSNYSASASNALILGNDSMRAKILRALIFAVFLIASGLIVFKFTFLL